jgi:hypothetical protein
MTTLRFDRADLCELPATPGWHSVQITSARYRTSACGNLMVHVVYALSDADNAHVRLAEYFVIEGSTRSALAMARRQLVELYRAIGHEPKAGEEVLLELLIGAELEIELGQDRWQGRPRLRVIKHRPRSSSSRDPQDPPF